MKIFYSSLFILMILFKTGNVLSDGAIFTVNNIEINKNAFKTKEELINIAFKKGFNKLNKKILLDRDYKRIESTSLQQIRNLISHYQIVNKKEDNKEFININIYFKKNKIYDFFYKNNIKYSDIVGKNLKILPIVIKNENIFIFDDNYFYQNWLLKKNEKKQSEMVDYTFPLESLEIIEVIKKNKDNLESVDLSKVFDEHLNKDNLFIVINLNRNKTRIFLKGIISSNKIIKNIEFKNPGNLSSVLEENILIFLKKEIVELIKYQNIIDVGAPSFLNINLVIKKTGDLLNAQQILNQIDLIDSFYVNEFDKNNASVKIKYYGKINKIKEKLTNNGIKLVIKNNQWKASIN